MFFSRTLAKQSHCCHQLVCPQGNIVLLPIHVLCFSLYSGKIKIYQTRQSAPILTRSSNYAFIPTENTFGDRHWLVWILWLPNIYNKECCDVLFTSSLLKISSIYTVAFILLACSWWESFLSFLALINLGCQGLWWLLVIFLSLNNFRLLFNTTECEQRCAISEMPWPFLLSITI